MATLANIFNRFFERGLDRNRRPLARPVANDALDARPRLRE